MAKESLVIRMVKTDYSVIGLGVESTFKKTELLLRLYRKINWSVDDRLDELNMLTYDSCMGDTETLSYLLNFAPDKELDTFKSRAVNAMQTRVLIDLINRAVTKIKDYPISGGEYYSIFDLKFINQWQYSETEILEQLNMERSTYYRKKKEALYILGFILFGLVMPDYLNRCQMCG